MKKLLVTLLVLFASLAFAEQEAPIKMRRVMGTETGNGGDCVNIGDKCVPRDLLGKKSRKLFIPVSKKEAREFWMSTSGFVELMNDIAAVHPGLTLSIWSELSSANLYLVDWELDLLPASETGMNSEYQADRQVCIRGKYDIICSLPAYGAVPNEYKVVWPLHEAFHPMFEHDISPVRHEKVRALTSFLIENRRNLNPAELQEMFQGMNLHARHIYLYDHKSADTSELDDQIVKTLTNTSLPFESRCQLKLLVDHGVLKNDYRFASGFYKYSYFFETSITDWGGYNDCTNKDLTPSQNYRTLYPSLINAIEMEMGVRDAYVSEYNYKDFCEEISQPQYKQKLAEYDLTIEKGQIEFADLQQKSQMAQSDPAVDEALKLNLKIAASMIQKSNILEGRAKIVKKGINELANKLVECEKAKMLANRNWLERFLGIGE